MNRLSREKLGNCTSPLAVNVVHRCLFRSKTCNFEAFRSSPAIYRPSGDQRGEKKPLDPGMVSICRVDTSKIRSFSSFVGSVSEQKSNLVPSGDQFGSLLPPASLGNSFRALPPS